MEFEVAEVEAELLELVRLMPSVIRALKRQAGGGGTASLRGLLDDGSLGPRHLPIVVALSFDGPLTVSELARRIGLGLAATSLMVGELHRAGIVEREVDERDRRRTLVSIGAPLREQCVHLARERLAPLRRALERMGPEMRSQFLAGWRVLAEETAGLGDVEPERDASQQAVDASARASRAGEGASRACGED